MHSFRSVSVDVLSDWSFSGQTEEKNNKTHLKLTKLVTRIHDNSPKNVKIRFDGLFGGNKALGKHCFKMPAANDLPLLSQ